jgi:hypothetical protein
VPTHLTGRVSGWQRLAPLTLAALLAVAGQLMGAVTPAAGELALSLGPPPSPTPRWTPATTVTRGDVDFFDEAPVDLAAGWDGLAVAIYAGDGRVRVRQQTAAGRWGPPVTIGRGSKPQIVLDRAGNATATWIGIGYNVMSARKPVGGRWSEPRRISPPTPDPDPDVVIGIFYFELAANPSGDVAAAWVIHSEDDPRVRNRAQVAYRPAHGTWLHARTVDRDTNVGLTPPELAVRGDGGVVTVWLSDDGLLTRNRIAGGGWRPTRRLATGDIWAFDVAVGGGSAAAVWTKGRGGPTSTVRAARRPPGRGWTQPVTLATSGINLLTKPRVWVDGTRRTTAAWSQKSVARVRTTGRQGNWAPATGFGSISGALDLAGNVDGALTMVWCRRDAQRLRVAYRPPGRAWQSSVALGRGARPYVALHPNGEAISVWAQANRLLSRRGEL